MVVGCVFCEVWAEGEDTFFVMEAVCVLFDLRADSEQTVENRTLSIVKVEYRYLWDIDCKLFPLRYLDVVIVNRLLWYGQII
jgi:hypothetical protein